MSTQGSRKQYEFVTTAAEVQTMAHALFGCKMLGVDTEFIRETTFYPKVALIQIADDRQTWLVDPTVLNSRDMEPLWKVLKAPDCLKIMHAAYSDQECFYTSYQFLVEPVLDTAVAAALLGMGDNLGLGRLLGDLLDVNVPKGRARARWLARPLTDDLLDYAAADVHYLVELGTRLCEELNKLRRLPWALEESTVEQKVFDVTPEELAQRLGKSSHLDPQTYLCLLEVVRWREGRAKGANMPRAWVADNETLLALAKSKPRSINELRSFRGLNGKEVEKSGESILQALERGKNAPRDQAPRFPRGAPRGENEDHVLDLVGSYIAFLAARHQVANRFLFNSNRGSALLANATKDPASWVEMGILSHHAEQLIGQDLKSFLSGKKAMAVKNNDVAILDLP